MTARRPDDRAAVDVALARQVRRRAVLCVLSRAGDAAEGAELLAALGLDPREGRTTLAHTVSLPVGFVYGPARLNDPRSKR